MRKLIDVDSLLHILPDDLPYKSSVEHVLIQAPNAVVSCARCKYHRENGAFHYCSKHGVYCPDDSEYFCAYGAAVPEDSLPPE